MAFDWMDGLKYHNLFCMTRFRTALLFDGSTVTAHDKITHLYPKTLLYFLNVLLAYFSSDKCKSDLIRVKSVECPFKKLILF